MLIGGAIALIVVVVFAIVGLLTLDLRRTDHAHWLDALKTWQGLIGSVLGFLGAAGVLVLSTSIQSDAEVRRATAASHAIGLGLAYEVQAMGVGLRAAQQVGHKDLAAADPGSTCLGYAQTLQQALITTTPVYSAVLPRMVDFGDENLHAFVTFHSLYANLLRTVPDVIDHDCTDAATAPVFLAWLVGQVDQIMLYYGEIAANYGIASAETGNPGGTAAPPSIAALAGQ